MPVGRPLFRLWSRIVGRPVGVGRPVVRKSPCFQCFGSGVVVPVVRRGSVVRVLGRVGRRVNVDRPAAVACEGWDLAGHFEPPGVESPVGVGRPMTGSFERPFFLSAELVVLAVLSIGCS